MNQWVKLGLDVVMGAAIPIAILTYLTTPLGAPTAYVLAAMVPVGWVFADLLLITRAFNYVTSYAGLVALVNGGLAFWFVDGTLFALKDSAGFLVGVVIFGGSVVVGRPLVRSFFQQVVRPVSPAQHTALARLLGLRGVDRSMLLASAIIVGVNVVLACVNFYLNLVTVQATFGTELFNQQVAQVNAITRVGFPLPSMLGFGGAILLVYRAVFRHLPSEEGRSQFESNFWDLVRLAEGGPPSGHGVAATAVDAD